MTSFSGVQASLLRHRNEMRIMTAILENADLYEQFQAEVEEQTGNTESHLGPCSSLCKPWFPCCGTSTDATRIKALEDENTKLRRELQDRRNFIIATRSMVAKTTRDMGKAEAPILPQGQ